MKLLFSLLYVFLLMPLALPLKAADNLVLVTLDGVRWQEVFKGADQDLLENKKFVKNSEALKKQFWRSDKEQRRQQLMPFINQVVRTQGVLIGNRDKGSKMNLSNNWFFSYPGYSEILTGIADDGIDSNKKIQNKNLTVLEFLNNKPTYKGKVAAFGSWDVFPYIINEERSQLPVNAGFESATGYPLDERMVLLNKLQQEIPSPWHNARLDAFTYNFAEDYMMKQKPKVLYIALGESDDFAHDGEYDSYLKAIKRDDDFIKQLWTKIQSTTGYKDNTNLIITTDHGRGSTAEDWQYHASKAATQGYLKSLMKFKQGIVGSNHIWLAAIGPNVKNKRELEGGKVLYQNQIAATILSLLKESDVGFNKQVGKPITEIVK